MEEFFLKRHNKKFKASLLRSTVIFLSACFFGETQSFSSSSDENFYGSYPSSSSFLCPVSSLSYGAQSNEEHAPLKGDKGSKLSQKLLEKRTLREYSQKHSEEPSVFNGPDKAKSVHHYMYTDEDINTAMEATLAHSTTLERVQDTTYLLKPKEGDELTFHSPNGSSYYVALLPACSCSGVLGQYGVPAISVNYFLDKEEQSTEVNNLVTALQALSDKDSMIACIENRERSIEANFSVLKEIVGTLGESQDIDQVRAQISHYPASINPQQNIKDVMAELLDQTPNVPNAHYKIVFPFCQK